MGKGYGTSNAEVKRGYSGAYKTSAAVLRGCFVERAAAGTIATISDHTKVAHGVAPKAIAQGQYGHIRRFGVVEMMALAPIPRGAAIRSSLYGNAQRKTVTGELAVGSSLGLDSDAIVAFTDNEEVKWTSDNPADVGKYLLVIGIDGADDTTPKAEVIGPLVLANTYVNGSQIWSATGAGGTGGFVLLTGSDPNSKPVAAAGTITIKSKTTGTTLETLAAATISSGVYKVNYPTGAHGASIGDGKVNVVSDGASVKSIIYYGNEPTAWGIQLELEVLNGTTGVPSTSDWAVLTYVVMSDVEAAQTLTFTGTNDGTNKTQGYAVTECLVHNGMVLVDLNVNE